MRLLLLLWTLPGGIQYLQEVHYARTFELENFSPLQTALRCLPGWYDWALYTPLVVWAVRAWHPGRRGWALSLALHALLGLALGVLHLLYQGALKELVPLGHVPEQTFSTWLKINLWSLQPQGSVMAYGVLVAATLGLDARRQADERAAHSARLEAQLHLSQLEALRGQLRPHFLFNALNSVQVMMREDVNAAEGMLLRLSQLLRRSLESAEQATIPLREELELLELYLGVEAVRFSDRLRVEYDIDPDSLDCPVPAWLLQPLAENAIRHGLGPRIEGGTLTVRSRLRDGQLELEIEDDGEGFEVGTSGNGIGLGNVRGRLEQLCPGEFHLNIDSKPSAGTRVTLRLPIQAREPS